MSRNAKPTSDRLWRIGLMVVLGAGIGTVIGAVLGQVTIGIAVGALFGIAVGMFLEISRRRKNITQK